MDEDELIQAKIKSSEQQDTYISTKNPTGKPLYRPVKKLSKKPPSSEMTKR